MISFAFYKNVVILLKSTETSVSGRKISSELLLMILIFMLSNMFDIFNKINKDFPENLKFIETEESVNTNIPDKNNISHYMYQIFINISNKLSNILNKHLSLESEISMIKQKQKIQFNNIPSQKDIDNQIEENKNFLLNKIKANKNIVFDKFKIFESSIKDIDLKFNEFDKYIKNNDENINFILLTLGKLFKNDVADDGDQS
jgi:hypothetical protein